MKLVILDTPAQARQLREVLGTDWSVEYCLGITHDLPKDVLGIDREHDFQPQFAVVPWKDNLVRRLIRALHDCEAVYCATPPDSRGELMALHLQALTLRMKDKPFHRVRLASLTPEAIRAAFAETHALHMTSVDAALAERLIDRLASWTINAVAQQVSAFPGLSHTALIALCRLAERQTAIDAIVEQERFGLQAHLLLGEQRTQTTLHHPNGAPITFASMETLNEAERYLEKLDFWIDKTGGRDFEEPAPPPYTLAAILKDAEEKKYLAPDETLSLLNMLYDSGWITYAESVIPESLIETGRAYITRTYGPAYVNTALKTPLTGLAPADVERIPSDFPGNGAALYTLIWRRFLAALMVPMRLRRSGARVLAGRIRTPKKIEFRASNLTITFDGWSRAMLDDERDVGGDLSDLKSSDDTLLLNFTPVIHNVPMPDTFTPAALIAQYGSAHPKQWAAAVQELKRANAVSDWQGVLSPTEDGRKLADWLLTRFPSVVSETAVEAFDRDLERIARGERTRVEVMRAFWERLTAEAHPEAFTPHKPIVLRAVKEGS